MGSPWIGAGRAYVIADDTQGLALLRADGSAGVDVVRRWAGRDTLKAAVGVDARGRAIVVSSTARGLLADADGRRSWLARGPHLYLAGQTDPGQPSCG
jgi:hypothetical protein